MAVNILFNGEDAEKLTSADSSVTHTLTIKNLPVGTYQVTESTDVEYTQSKTTISDLIIPNESIPVAEFTNTVKRKTGDLYLEKELIAADDYYQELPEGTKFYFTIKLLEDIPAEKQTFSMKYSSEYYTDGDEVPQVVIMSDGEFDVVLEAGWNVTINDLPEGRYRITEATVPSYANAFAHDVNGVWVTQPSTTDAGQMYTEIVVPGNKTAKVKCTNTYPVNYAELIIQKLVTKEYDPDVLPDDTFIFTVVLETSNAERYNYVIYDSAGVIVQPATRSASVINKSFEISLKNGQYAVIPGMPVCDYTVSETAKDTFGNQKTMSEDYSTSYCVYVSETGESASTTVKKDSLNASGNATNVTDPTSVRGTFSAGKTDALEFTNTYKRYLCNLTINKSVDKLFESTDTFLFHVTGDGVDLEVAINGSGSVTIQDLKPGTYTVTENESWSWRYEAADKPTDDPVTLVRGEDGKVSFSNKLNTNQWLSSTAYNENNFNGKYAGVSNTGMASQASILTLNHVLALVNRKGEEEDEG